MLESLMLHAKFQDHRTSSSGEESFYHVWAWRPSWSCDLDRLYKLSFPLPKEAPHNNYLALISQAVSEEKMFEHVDDNDDNNVRWSMGIL